MEVSNKTVRNQVAKVAAADRSGVVPSNMHTIPSRPPRPSPSRTLRSEITPARETIFQAPLGAQAYSQQKTVLSEPPSSGQGRAATPVTISLPPRQQNEETALSVTQDDALQSASQNGRLSGVTYDDRVPQRRRTPVDAGRQTMVWKKTFWSEVRYILRITDAAVTRLIDPIAQDPMKRLGAYAGGIVFAASVIGTVAAMRPPESVDRIEQAARQESQLEMAHSMSPLRLPALPPQTQQEPNTQIAKPYASVAELAAADEKAGGCQRLFESYVPEDRRAAVEAMIDARMENYDERRPIEKSRGIDVSLDQTKEVQRRENFLQAQQGELYEAAELPPCPRAKSSGKFLENPKLMEKHGMKGGK